MVASKKSVSSSPNYDELVKTLVEQNIILTKKSAEMVAQVKMLTSRVDKLVGIFEKASKDIGKVQTSDEMVKALSERLGELLEQNKTIASGLIALERYVRHRSAETQTGQM